MLILSNDSLLGVITFDITFVFLGLKQAFQLRGLSLDKETGHKQTFSAVNIIENIRIHL